MGLGAGAERTGRVVGVRVGGGGDEGGGSGRPRRVPCPFFNDMVGVVERINQRDPALFQAA